MKFSVVVIVMAMMVMSTCQAMSKKDWHILRVKELIQDIIVESEIDDDLSTFEPEIVNAHKRHVHSEVLAATQVCSLRFVLFCFVFVFLSFRSKYGKLTVLCFIGLS